MTTPILVIDDESAMCELLADGLSTHGYDVTWTTNASDALRRIADQPVEVVVTDVHLPGVDGLELCGQLLAAKPDRPVIVLTAFGSIEMAVRAMRIGAYDFLTKPVDIEVLALALDRAVRNRQLRQRVEQLEREVSASKRLDDIVGSCPAMTAVYRLVERAAPTDSTVLVLGETGTGKELVARALHRHSARAHKPFVAINCAAVPEALLESELFGHARGAFTDAREARTGLFQHAQGGTLFLDEIGEMPLGLQPKLLRTLQERTIRPVGSDREVEVDVRIVAATHRDLEAAVQDGNFREDLFYRINVVPIELPPLKARGADVLTLARHFLERHADRSGKSITGISPAAAERLLAYDWPGNVRELHNCIERAVALSGSDVLGVEDLTERIRSFSSSHVLVSSADPSELVSLEEVEQRYIRHVLEAVGGNKTQAARILGLDRKTLHRKLEARQGGG